MFDPDVGAVIHTQVCVTHVEQFHYLVLETVFQQSVTFSPLAATTPTTSYEPI